MFRLVLSIVLLAILAVFIAFNAKFKTDINFFGYMMDDIAVVSVVLLTLAAGVMYSFGLYLVAHFSKRRLKKGKLLHKQYREKEKALQEQAKALKETETANSGAKILHGHEQDYNIAENRGESSRK